MFPLNLNIPPCESKKGPLHIDYADTRPEFTESPFPIDGHAKRGIDPPVLAKEEKWIQTPFRWGGGPLCLHMKGIQRTVLDMRDHEDSEGREGDREYY